MKNQNKKGFTLVELVIVIAVIAILAGVLIGTFATVISRANQSKAVQEWKARVDEAYVEYVADNHVAPASVKVDNKTIKFGDGTFENGFVALNSDVFVTLDTTNKVYLVWDNDNTSGSTYSVATSTPTGFVESTTQAFVQAYVQAQLGKVQNATHYVLTGGESVAFTSIVFSTNSSETPIQTANAVTLGTFSGKTWQATFTGDAAPYSVTVAPVQ